MSEPFDRSGTTPPSDLVWPKYRYFPLGDGALTVECGNVVDFRLGRISTSIAQSIQQNGFPGLIEAVPAFASTTIFYRTETVRRSFPEFSTAFEAVKDLVAKKIDQIICVGDPDATTIEIPIVVDEHSAPDLQRVAEYAGFEREEAIDTFLASSYRVYMLGFLPGFAYMGDVNERLAAPRLGSPRTKVPKGSVGIAGKQTGIYPLDSPGGWNIVGRTDLEMFDPAAKTPCLLRPGDEVRFVRR